MYIRLGAVVQYMRSGLDPEVERLLERQDTAPIPPLDSVSVDTMRRLFESWNESDGTPEVGATTDIAIDGPGGEVPLRFYSPEGDGPHPLLVYYHGGGWVLGTLDTHDSICRELTNAANCITVSVGYRLAPEHPFPAAVEDAYAALRWVADHGSNFGGDEDRIAVAGDSAGGTLATVMCLLARERNSVDIAAQSLVYPVTAFDEQFDSVAENAKYGLASDPDWFKDQYLESEIDGHNPYAFPLQERDVSRLPPAFVITSEFDTLRDDGIAYAERLKEVGVLDEHRHFDGMIHGFLHYDRLDARAEAFDAIGAFLTRAFDERSRST